MAQLSLVVTPGSSGCPGMSQGTGREEERKNNMFLALLGFGADKWGGGDACKGLGAPGLSRKGHGGSGEFWVKGPCH